MSLDERILLLLTALRDRPDSMAAPMLDWLERNHASVTELAGYLQCDVATLERLAALPVPRPGPDEEGDLEIIAASLRLSLSALRAMLSADETAREVGG